MCEKTVRRHSSGDPPPPPAIAMPDRFQQHSRHQRQHPHMQYAFISDSDRRGEVESGETNNNSILRQQQLTIDSFYQTVLNTSLVMVNRGLFYKTTLDVDVD